MSVEARAPNTADIQEALINKEPGLAWHVTADWASQLGINSLSQAPKIENPSLSLKAVDAVTKDEACPSGFHINKKGNCKPDASTPEPVNSIYVVPEWVLKSPIDPGKFVDEVCANENCQRNLIIIDQSQKIDEKTVKSSFNKAVYGGILKTKNVEGVEYVILPINKDGKVIAEYLILADQAPNFFNLMTKTEEELISGRETRKENINKFFKVSGISAIIALGGTLIYKIMSQTTSKTDYLKEIKLEPKDYRKGFLQVAAEELEKERIKNKEA